MYMSILSVIPFATNVYKKFDERKENFKQQPISYDKLIVSIFFQIMAWFITFYALYLSVKRNNGFHLGSILMAFFYGICYIIYAMIVPV